MQGLGILRSSNRRDICYAKSVAATFGTNMEVSDRAWAAMVTVAVKLGVITQADVNDQDDQNVGDAFVERVKKGMDALTVRGEMDKKLAKEQEKFRDFATHDMLAAADKYDNGTTQVLIAKPNRSQTRIVGEAFRFWLAIVMGYNSRSQVWPGWEGSQVHHLQRRSRVARQPSCVMPLLSCCNPHQACGYSL